MNGDDGFVALGDDALDVQVVEQISKTHEQSPEVAQRFMEMTNTRMSHIHKLRWAYFWLRVGSTLLGFGALVAACFVAVHFVEAGAPVAASAGFAASAVTAVATFFTGRAGGSPERKGEV